MKLPRVIIGMLAGQPVFRISRPGKSALSTNLADFAVREDMRPVRPAASGILAGTGSPALIFSFPGAVAYPPLILSTVIRGDGTTVGDNNFLIESRIFFTEENRYVFADVDVGLTLYWWLYQDNLSPDP